MKTNTAKKTNGKTLCFLLVSCLFIANPLLIAQKARYSVSISANVNETIITPPVGAYLYPTRKPSTGIHDDLFARSLVLSDGRNTIVIVTLDLHGLDPKLVANIRTEVQKQTGIRPENLMLNTTHTHNCPVTTNYNFSLQRHRNKTWENQLINNITLSIIKAKSHLMPVQLFAGRDSVIIGYNRRPNGGPLVPWVDVLQVNKMNKMPLAILFSHAAHPVNVHVSTTEITKDYPGYAIRKVNEYYNNQIVSMFAQACGGNILSYPLSAGYTAAEKAGNTLGASVINASKKSTPIDVALFHTMLDTVYLPYKDIEMKTAENLMSEILNWPSGSHPSEDDIKNENSNLNNWAKTMVKYSKGELFSKGQPIEIQAFSLSKDFVIIALNHEVFAEYQLYLTKNSPYKHTTVLAYTNVTDTYIPTDEAIRVGGYEPNGAPKLYGVLPLKQGCERILNENCIRILTQLKSLYNAEIK